MRIFDFVLIGSSDGILKNLPITLKKAGFKILSIAPKETTIFNSNYIDANIECEGSSDEEFIESLIRIEHQLQDIQGTFLWCSDIIMKKVAESELELTTKIHILPVKNPDYFGIFDSKAHQTELFEEVNVPQPISVVFKSSITEQALEIFGEKSVLCKRSSGGGGAFIRKFENSRELMKASTPREWYPVVIQEYIPGVNVSVEAYYKDGRLLLGLCSVFVLETSLYGPSVVRDYDSKHLGYLQSTLEQIGKKIQIDGFVNVTFRKNVDDEYKIIEFDPRPNVWHGAFHDLQVDLRNSYSLEQLELNPVQYQKRMHDPERLFGKLVADRDFKYLLNFLMGRNLKDYGVAITSHFAGYHNHFSFRLLRVIDVIFLIRRMVLKMLVVIKGWIPASSHNSIDRSAARAFLLRVLQ